MSAKSNANATLLLAESAEAEMQRAARGAVGFETGGILLGVLTGGNPYVAWAVEIPSATPSSYRYRVPDDVTQPIVARIQQADGRLGYLGEWHVHPANVPPSLVDKRTMTRLSRKMAQEGVEPVLVVLCRTSNDAYAITASRWGRSGELALHVLRVGDLPVPPSESA